MRMANARQVITLQVGHCANHVAAAKIRGLCVFFEVGAHFWNFQDEAAARGDDESLDATRLFHRAEQGVEWRPRLLSIDRRGAAGSASLEEPLEPAEEARDQGMLEAAQAGGLWEALPELLSSQVAWNAQGVAASMRLVGMKQA